MKRVRGVLLPLLLCGLILAAGVLLPQLLLRRTPDYKDAPSAVDIAGAESPLYLESEADIRLPPWDVIDAHASLPLSAYTGLTEMETHPVLNQYIGALAAPFCGAVAEDQNFADAMRVSAGQFFYLRDYPLSEEQDGRTLSLVLDALGRPLYLHTRGAAEQAERDLAEAVLAVRGRYGKNALLRGTSYREGATGRERNEQVGGHHA